MYDLILKGYTSKVHAIKAISDTFGVDLMTEARAMVNGVPTTLCESEDQEWACDLARQFKLHGMSCEVVQHTPDGYFYQVVMLGNFDPAQGDKHSYYVYGHDEGA